MEGRWRELGGARVYAARRKRVGEGARAAGESARGEAGVTRRGWVEVETGGGGEGGILYAAVARVRRSGRLALDYFARSHFSAVIIIDPVRSDGPRRRRGR